MRKLTKSAAWALMSSAVRVGALDLLRPRNSPSATALLFHRFFAPGEPRRRSLDRLRRTLLWLQTNFTPLSLPEFVAALTKKELPDQALLVTTDDALIDLVSIVEEFNEFQIPLSAFVCVGWTAAASKGTGEDLLARTVSAIQWYEGPDLEVRLGPHFRLALSDGMKARNIDNLLQEYRELTPYMTDFCDHIEGLANTPRQCCTWEELRQLTQAGVSIGAHSVTHVRMSSVSEQRLRFEVNESKRLCELFLEACDAFAYPFGMSDTHNLITRNAVEAAGFSAAFLTHSDYITHQSDVLTLPRIALPDEPMSMDEFRARAGGASIALRRIKGLARRPV